MRENTEGSPVAHIRSSFLTVLLKNVTKVVGSRVV